MMEVMLAKKKSMSELVAPLKIYLQVLENVRVAIRRLHRMIQLFRKQLIKLQRHWVILAAFWCVGPALSLSFVLWWKHLTTLPARSMLTK